MPSPPSALSSPSVLTDPLMSLVWKLASTVGSVIAAIILLVAALVLWRLLDWIATKLADALKDRLDPPDKNAA